MQIQKLNSLMLMVFLVAACDRNPAPPPSSAPSVPVPEVTIATPLQKDVIDSDEYTARLAAVKSVDISARVRGYLESIHFQEGVIVRENDLLYIIDPRPYRAALDNAQANLAQAVAAYNLADSDLARAERLFNSHTISREVFDSRHYKKQETAAAVEAARSAVKLAQLELDYTHIKAPITGRIGRTRVTEGNLVKGGDSESTLLTTIVSLDPIYAYLTADEQTLLRYLRMNEGSFRKTLPGKGHPVFIRLVDEQEYTREGYIDFIDNKVDPSTGTLEVRAVVANPDQLLLPGMFAHIQIPGAAAYNALLVPDSAINVDQTLRYVFVVNKDNIAERRNVTPGRKAHGLRVIVAGLQSSDRVIINGIQRVQPGSMVNPQAGVIEAQAIMPAIPATP